MSGRLLLDTNVIIALFPEDSNLHELLAGAQEVFVPVVAIREQYFGAYKSVKVKENLAVIDEFALSSTVLACDAGTAKRYGEIKNRLKEKGQPIPENDMWVAAIAQQHGLGLMSKDVHFEAIENLMVQSY